MYRFRFGLVYVALALAVAGSAYGGLRGLHARVPASRHAEPASCSAPRVGHDPVMTALTFIHAAVERANPKAGFALATPALRGATTCDDWARGKLPVRPYRQVDWQKAQYKVEARAGSQIVLQVLLASSKVPEERPTVFVLELHRFGAQWRVGFWAPADVEA